MDLLLKRIDLDARIMSFPGCDELSRFFFVSAACGQGHFVQLLLEKGCDPLAQILLQNRIDTNDGNFGEPAFDKFKQRLMAIPILFLCFFSQYVPRTTLSWGHRLWRSYL